MSPALVGPCCICNSADVVYRNYQQQEFCENCAEGDPLPGADPVAVARAFVASIDRARPPQLHDRTVDDLPLYPTDASLPTLTVGIVRALLAEIGRRSPNAVRSSPRAAHPVQIRICTLRDMLRHRHHADFDEIERHLGHLDREIAQLLAIARTNDRAPARITLTAHHEGDPAMADQFPANEPIVITADVENAEHVQVPDTLTWTTTGGTITADPTTLTATLTGAPLGDVTVSVVDPLGITADLTVTIVDNTPASISLSAALATAAPSA